MTQQEIRENNTLLATFLGAKENFQGTFEMYGIIPEIEDGEKQQHFFYPSEMPFDSDWNWVMTVLEKIERTNVGKLTFTVSIYKESSEITAYSDDVIINGVSFPSGVSFIQEDGETRIESLYKAVVEFAKWHKHNT